MNKYEKFVKENVYPIIVITIVWNILLWVL
jgi:hypothetical protein